MQTGGPLPGGANAILRAQRTAPQRHHGLADGICLRHLTEPLTGSQVPWTLPMSLDFTDGAARHGPTRQPHWTLPMSLDFTDRGAESHSSATLDFTDELGLYR
jgi:hypothetical protein